MQSEAALARRVKWERESRKWTFDGLAKRMTDAGCPIQGSAIYKIEKGDPPRRITVDELVAFGKVFDRDIPDLLLPPEVLVDEQVKEIVGNIGFHMEGIWHNAWNLRISLNQAHYLMTNDEDVAEPMAQAIREAARKNMTAQDFDEHFKDFPGSDLRDHGLWMTISPAFRGHSGERSPWSDRAFAQAAQDEGKGD